MRKQLSFYFFLLVFSAIAQPKLGHSWKNATLGEVIETPLGFLNKQKVTQDNTNFSVGLDKSNKVVYVETASPAFKVENYSLASKLSDFKNYTYTRYFEGWGYYLRINKNWCAYFGKAKPTMDTRAVNFFNYNFGKAEGKQIFDSSYEETLEAHKKAQAEKAEKKRKELEAKTQKKSEYEKAQAQAEEEKAKAEKEQLAYKEKLKQEAEKLRQQEEDKKKQAELEKQKKKEEFLKEQERKEKAEKEKAAQEAKRLAELQKGAEARKKKEEEKKKAEEERKRQYAKELAEYNAKKEAEKKAKEAERIRRSEEFRTGQKIQNTEWAEQDKKDTPNAQPAKNQGKGNGKNASNKNLSAGEKLLDSVLQSKLKKSLADYLSFVQKNKKHTEAYPLVLVNYKDVAEYSSAQLAKIQQIKSTTVFKKGHKRTEDFKDKGAHGVVIIKVDFK